MKRIVITLTALLAIGCGCSIAVAQGPASKVAWELTEGVQSPESAYYDQETDTLFVSQIGDGGPTGKDQDGYITRLSPEGKVLDLKWITGLNAPKGMRSHEGRLWVSDIDQLIEIDMTEGKVAQKIAVPDAVFLNDVACSLDGTVYVSDMMGLKIYKYRDGKVEVFAEGEETEYPNGLLVAGDKLVVAAWGKPNEDFSTEVPGRLFSLDLKTGEKSLITPEPFGNLDGLETVGDGRYIVSDWFAGKVFFVAGGGRSRQILELPKGAADIGIIRGKRLLVVPQMLENEVTAFEVGRPGGSE